MDFKGWHPRSVKFEPPTQEAEEAFLEFVEKSSLEGFGKWLWNKRCDMSHADRVKEAFIFCTEQLHANNVETPENITGLLTKSDIIQFNKLVEHQFPREHLKTACQILCLRERYMFACAFHKSFLREKNNE